MHFTDVGREATESENPVKDLPGVDSYRGGAKHFHLQFRGMRLYWSRRWQTRAPEQPTTLR